MAQNNELVLTITARDQATETLKRVKGQVKDFSDDPALTKFGKDVDAVGAAFDRLGATVTPLAPALQQLSRIMTSSVAGAATGLVSAFTAYSFALSKVTEEQARFQRAINSQNYDTVRGEVSRLNDEIQKMSDIGLQIGGRFGNWLDTSRSLLNVLRSFPQAFNEKVMGAETPESQRDRARTIGQGLFSVDQGIRQTALLSQIEDTKQRAILFEMQRRLNAGDIEGAIALRPKFAASDQREEDLALDKLRRTQAKETSDLVNSGLLKENEKNLALDALRESHRLEQQDLRARMGIDLQRQQIAREEQINNLRKQARERRYDVTYDEADAFSGLKQGESLVEFGQRMSFLAQAKAFEGKEAAPEPGLDEVARLEAFAVGTADQDVIGRGRKVVTDQNQSELTQSRNLQREGLQIEQQLLDVQRNRADLTQSERDSIEISTSLRREQLRLAELQLEQDQAQTEEAKALVERKKDLVTAQEQVLRTVVETQRLQREDPAAGLAKGFQDIAEQGSAVGERLRGELVSSFNDINRSFSDIVIDGIYNKAENASEIGRQLGKKLLTGFVDQITTGITSRAFGAIQQLLGLGGTGSTGGRVLSAVPLVASPFTDQAPANGSGAGGTGGVLSTVYGAFSGTGGAASSPATATRGIRPSGAASSPATAGSGTFDLGGIGQFAQGFFGPSLSLVDIAGAYGAGGFAGVAEAQSLVAAGLTGEQAVAVVAVEASGVGAAEGTAAGVGVVSDAGVGGSSLAGAGSAAFGVVGGVLSAAALAYTAYSAYQSGDVVGGALGGAVSGAALGTVIYPGIGTVVGLIAGAAIGAGAGGAGKEEQEVKNDRRRNEADRQRRGAWIYQDLMNAINTGVDQEDVAQQTVRTGHSVGQLLMGVATLNQAGALRDAPWGWAPSTNAEKTQKILAGFGYAPLLDFQWDRLNSTMELIASWHQPRGITEGDIEISKNAEALMSAFVNKSGATVLLGYDEQFATGLRGAAGRLTRETLLLSSRAREAAGRDLFVVGNTLDGLDDDQAQRILERLARVDRDRDLQILRVESDFGATVTVGNRTPLLPPPPDPGTLIGERNIPEVFPSYSPYSLFADPSTNSSTL